MHRVLIVEDEEGIRKNIERMLSLEGYEVATAPNGQHGLIIARSMLPDIIISDINMPQMDGFAMLDAIRHHPDLERCIVIMLTAADDRENIRRGMRLGADDYLPKPFKREELLDSIKSQVRKRGRFAKDKENAIARATALTEEKAREHFMVHYQEQFAHSQSSSGFGNMFPNLETSSGFPRSGYPSESLEPSQVQATVMFADIRGFTTMAERLSAAELATLLGHYFELACKPVVIGGGTHLKMLGDGLLALFEEQAGDEMDGSSNHATRALMAACNLHQEAQKFKLWVDSEYGNRGLPPFHIGIGLHSGEVTLSRLGGAELMEITALGDAVNVASRLQAMGKELSWTIVASIDTAQLAGGSMKRGRMEMVNLRGREKPVSACEVLGIAIQTTTPSNLEINPNDAAHQRLKTAAEQNSQITARAAKDAIKESLWNLQSGSFQVMQQSFKSYQISRKLGEGGMSDVYLAWSAKQRHEVVLKVLRTSVSNDAEMLRRFIQEYAVLASLNHHHVARIYDQGFTDEYAYIAMEYLSGGTLKEDIRSRHQNSDMLSTSTQQTHRRIIDLLRQIVSALQAIHKLGLVYRDLKPENLMFRKAGGELVLVDFGIVKHLSSAHPDRDHERLVNTDHGQVIGTPYYVSPEQAMGHEVTHRSDFYSLGVMLYEMLTGSRPYRGDSLNELLARHLHAEIPRLPPEHTLFQTLLDSLMAKKPEDRPASTVGIWNGLEMLAQKIGYTTAQRV